MSDRPSSAAALVDINLARIDHDGAPLCDQLTVRCEGDRVVLAGPGAAAIASAVTLRARVVSGSVHIGGFDVASREHVCQVGIAALDPPLPPRMTVDGYLSLGFRTAGLSPRQAEAHTRSTLDALGLPSLAARRTESLAVPERRAVAIAQAFLPDSKSMFIEAPLSSLEGPAAHYLLAALGLASKRRRVIATTARYDAASGERDLIMGATHVAVLSTSAVAWMGAPADLTTGSLLTIAVQGEPRRFLDALRHAGFDVHGAPPRFAVSVPESASPTDLLNLAEETGVVIAEMTPVVPEV